MTDVAMEAETLPAQETLPCWMCERPSDPDASQRVTLESYGPVLDSLGHKVTVNPSERTVSVQVPRCRACRSWFAWRPGIIALSIFGGVLTPTVVLYIYSHLTGVVLASDMPDDTEGFGGFLIFFAFNGLSFVAFWVCGFAMLALALGHRPIRSRREKNFPPLAALRAVGWKKPKSQAE